jgi:glycosyltransferase involved in cell wall biosynthesis
LRDFTEAALKGRPITPERQQTQIQDEIELTEECDAVISVSALETRKFAEHGVKNIHTIGFCIKNNLGSASFSERQDILFVGSVHLMKSPNADSILWFSKEVFPKIQQSLQTSCRFLIVGTNLVPELETKVMSLDNPDIKFIGKAPDLAPIYNQARIFVAPTRYAAGIPQKVCEAAASGIPVVATSLIAQQLDWKAGEDLLVADSAKALAEECVRLYTEPELWERIRVNSASKVAKDCSPEVFNARLIGLLDSVDAPATS